MEDRPKRAFSIWSQRLLLFLVLSMPSPNAQGFDGNLAREELPAAWQRDADLTDVFFLDERLGWSVGSHGVMLRTIDGGKNWQPVAQVGRVFAEQIPLDQKIRNLRAGVRTRWTGLADGRANGTTKIRCRFESVFFIDENNGWVAGGYDVPYIDRSKAVILRTSDGGVSWRSVEGLVIPKIRRIHFSDRSNGWAVGDTGNLFRTGIYYTGDAGETWSSQSVGVMPDWRAGDESGGTFVNVDVGGKLGVVKQDQYEPSVLLDPPAGRFQSVCMEDQHRGWAVGESGMIYQTTNGGLSWSNVTSPSESERLRHFDFQTCCIAADKLWLGGNPGTIIFSVDLKQGTIEEHPTGRKLPIKKIYFPNRQRGFAVGNLGSILSTADGGKSWQVQRGQHDGLAMLAFDDESKPPLEMIATHAGEENRICGLATSSSADDAATWQSVERLGCATMVCVPGLQSTQRQEQVADLVKTIRTLRPRTLVCNTRFSRSVGPVGTVVDLESILTEAIIAAADRTAFEEQITEVQLDPWQVDRLAVLDPTGTLKLDPQRMLPRTGSLLGDRVALSRAVLGLPLLVQQKPIYRVQSFTLTPKQENDLFSGLSSLDQPVPSRPSDSGFRSDLSAIQLANTKEKKLQAFEKLQVRSPAQFMFWRQQVLAWALSLKQDLAGIWLMELADRYFQDGQTELAAATLEMLATRIPDHGLSPAALTWITQHYASDEMAQIAFRQLESSPWSHPGAGDESYPSPTRTLTVQASGVSHLIWQPAQPSKAAGWGGTIAGPMGRSTGQGTSDSIAVQAESFFQWRRQKAVQLLGKIGVRDPDLVAGPQYRWLEAKLKQKLKGASQTTNMLQGMMQNRVVDSAGISIAAEREMSIEGLIAATSTKIRFACFRTDSPPRLDGRLDDTVWAQAAEKNLGLHRFPVVGQSNADQDQVVLAYDAQYLYAAVRCNKLPGNAYSPTLQPRPRDPDLSRRDRVEFWLDVDRDYRSFSHFAVDYRGWVTDSCGGSRGWNPKWFVDCGVDEQSWTAEIAIPLDELVPGKIEPNTVWAIRLSRRNDRGEDLWSLGRGDGEFVGLRVGFYAEPVQYELIQFK